MSPLQFEQAHGAEWERLEQLLAQALGPRRARRDVPGPELLALYRTCCEHLALARDRGYPLPMIERLERLGTEGHQAVYHRQRLGLGGLVRWARRDFPRAVRAHRWHVLLAALLLAGPTIGMGVAVARHPELVTTVVSPATANEFEQMYSASAEHVGRTREADTDLEMFGFYISNNIGVAFQCYAGGILFGLGSLWCLLQNGLFGGAVGGYVVARGLSGTFFPFVATHSSFELTAIVLSGAAGLKVGQSLLAPGRRTRLEALAQAGRESIVVVYGVVAMLVVAAAMEAFWSPSAWLPPAAKYAVAALCWLAVVSWLVRAGRHGD